MKERKKEKILESLAGARQFVAWNTGTNCYEVFWITKKELVAQHGQQKADTKWKNVCFDGTYKICPGSREPITEGEALVSWMKRGWSWKASRAYWRRLTHARVDPKKPDDSSRKRMRRTLEKLIVIPE